MCQNVTSFYVIFCNANILISNIVLLKKGDVEFKKRKDLERSENRVAAQKIKHVVVQYHLHYLCIVKYLSNINQKNY